MKNMIVKIDFCHVLLLASFISRCTASTTVDYRTPTVDHRSVNGPPAQSGMAPAQNNILTNGTLPVPECWRDLAFGRPDGEFKSITFRSKETFLSAMNDIVDRVVDAGDVQRDGAAGDSDRRLSDTYVEDEVVVNDVDDPVECQMLCQSMTTCYVWMFDSINHACTLRTFTSIQSTSAVRTDATRLLNTPYMDTGNGTTTGTPPLTLMVDAFMTSDHSCSVGIVEACRMGTIDCLQCPNDDDVTGSGIPTGAMEELAACVWHSKRYVSGPKYCGGGEEVRSTVQGSTKHIVQYNGEGAAALGTPLKTFNPCRVKDMTDDSNPMKDGHVDYYELRNIIKSKVTEVREYIKSRLADRQTGHGRKLAASGLKELQRSLIATRTTARRTTSAADNTTVEGTVAERTTTEGTTTEGTTTAEGTTTTEGATTTEGTTTEGATTAEGTTTEGTEGTTTEGTTTEGTTTEGITTEGTTTEGTTTEGITTEGITTEGTVASDDVVDDYIAGLVSALDRAVVDATTTTTTTATTTTTTTATTTTTTDHLPIGTVSMAAGGVVLIGFGAATAAALHSNYRKRRSRQHLYENEDVPRSVIAVAEIDDCDEITDDEEADEEALARNESMARRLFFVGPEHHHAVPERGTQ